ncbi:hypothetical protein GIB67_036762, partial [Kingdonia uniflora]
MKILDVTFPIGERSIRDFVEHELECNVQSPFFDSQVEPLKVHYTVDDSVGAHLFQFMEMASQLKMISYNVWPLYIDKK